MPIARDQYGRTELDAAGLLGDAGERDPDVVAEGWNLGAPDRSKAELLGHQRILGRSRTGRQAEVIGQHGTLQG